MARFVKASVGAGAHTLDGVYYTSREVFAEEQERIFARDWVCVGREEQLAAVGDYLLAEVAGESLIVTRDAEGSVHAFYNVCRHRGTRICEQSSGHFTGSIQCPYHAWTYGLDGTLKVARNMHDVEGFSPQQFALREAAIASWEGFLFVSLASQTDRFERAFSSLIGRFAPWDMPSLRIARTIAYDVACNWKLIVQNYSECYHCPLVHPQLDKLSPSDSGRNDLDEGPFLGGYSELRTHGTSLTTTGATARTPVGTVSGDDINRIYYYALFPSMLLSLHADYVMAHTLRPISPDRTSITCSWLFDASEIAKPSFDPSDAVDFWDLTNRQDWHVSELTQRGVSSRAYTPGPYSNAEGLLAAFDRHYLSVMQ